MYIQTDIDIRGEWVGMARCVAPSLQLPKLVSKGEKKNSWELVIILRTFTFTPWVQVPNWEPSGKRSRNRLEYHPFLIGNTSTQSGDPHFTGIRYVR